MVHHHLLRARQGSTGKSSRKDDTIAKERCPVCDRLIAVGPLYLLVCQNSETERGPERLWDGVYVPCVYTHAS